jgi:CAAX protease family protein
MKHQRPNAPSVTVESLTVPFALAFSAPMAVIIGIELLRSVWWTFALYQGVICLISPAIESRVNGRGWREHAILLGLVEGAETGTPSRGQRSRLLLAGALALVTALVTGGFLVLTHDLFLAPDRLDATITGWGVSSKRVPAMLAVMGMLDAAAEELFWRGYIPGRVAWTRPDKAGSTVLTILLPAVLYASYHAVTIGHLVDKGEGAIIMTGGVLGAGVFWGWLRHRTGSVWPPLLSHAGAVLAYLAIDVWLSASVH